MVSSLFAYLKYSLGVGNSPFTPATAASSADAKNTLAPVPKRLGKFRVEVDTTVESSATRAWLPIHKEHPGISIRAPALPKML